MLTPQKSENPKQILIFTGGRGQGRPLSRVVYRKAKFSLDGSRKTNLTSKQQEKHNQQLLSVVNEA